eukprot:Blabericola_migrator_1__9915@NODE_547_length_7703_cov_86_120351_g413_i0_p3_GENE_NODE_547_length_7703_cov_86_120351_g413_i0NODE_547_length_7703_cov_86_120351_g413_i0_p3_ORF_typecomplete_len597_score83_38TFIIB/PF00382_19/6_4e15TFIIB/PF00382_19/9e13BRF1/PF07741_13/1_6e03BRF1/PF07741_13/7_7e11TF_Zn_Ribbon/PF08271_12/4_9e06DZR/PF12773_7/0_15Prim_Zn_Ribbon/PF08273_12/0_41Lar_restr_allev/PF14354_6/0_51Zn_Tnp_IS1595/PF12760_7/1_6zfISL3/PF14690_6/1_2_NODE_547_length_7703_cov_86_120351_g413_i022584048
MAAQCPHCGCSQRARNDDRGEEICTGCGAVLSESAMVDQLTFAGGGRMTGSFVDTLTGATKGFAAAYGQRGSRQLALQRGWYNLERVANRLGLAQSLIEAAKRMYHLALNRNFTLGRNNLFVVSACLYAACRRDHSAYMMIDFSDAVLAPVRSLTQVFMKLIRALRLNVPSVDPSLFMERFAMEMNLGDMTMKVAQTGVRLVQAMARDWLVTGRRPLGLCAAALLIAARFHGLKINSEDIDTIFRVSYSTVDKRLAEFQRTATAALPAKDFEKTDLLALPSLAQPPCVLEQEQRSKRRLALTDGKAAMRANKKHKALREALIEDDDDDQPLAGGDAIQANAENVIPVSPMAGKILLPTLAREGACREDLRVQDVAAMATGIAEAIAAESGGLTPAEQDKLGNVIRDVGLEAPHIIEYINKEIAGPSRLEEELMLASTQPSATMPEDDVSTFFGSSSPVPPDSLVASTQEVTGKEELARTLSVAPAHAKNDEEDLSLTDIDESLVDSLLLSEQESQSKMLIWDELTKDYIAAVYERQDERRMKAAQKSGKPYAPRKRREPLPPMASAVDAVRASLSGISPAYQKGLDEAALEELFAL